MGEKSVTLQSKCTHCIGAVLKNLGHSSGVQPQWPPQQERMFWCVLQHTAHTCSELSCGQFLCLAQRMEQSGGFWPCLISPFLIDKFSSSRKAVLGSLPGTLHREPVFAGGPIAASQVSHLPRIRKQEETD